MKKWMVGLFFSFERYRHVPEYYLQYTLDDDDEGKNHVKAHVGFRRQLWVKGNLSEIPDTDTPVAWVCTIGGEEEGEEGCLRLQFKGVSLYWDKTRTVELLGKKLPSD